MAALSLAAAPTVKIGADSYGETTLESLEVLGTVKLNGTTVSNRLKVVGNLSSNGAILYDVEAEGNAKFISTTLKNKTRIIGALQADRSDFHQPLVFSGQKALFSNCKLSGITIQRDPAFKAKQVIELKNGTTVDGPIVFEGEGGEVHLYPGSKAPSSIAGGKVVRKN